MEETTYVFIDGGYLSPLYRETVNTVFGPDWKLDFQNLCSEYDARKSFYYDCLDETQHDSETDDQRAKRIADQKAEFERIRSVRGMHIRLGKLASEGKRRRQKQVDIRISVDMMNHAFRQNMTKAILIAGDSDFRPLVESLVQIGTFVEVHCGIRAAQDLYEAADHHKFLNIEELSRLTVQGLEYPRSGSTDHGGDIFNGPSYTLQMEGSTSFGKVRYYGIKPPGSPSGHVMAYQMTPRLWRCYHCGELSLAKTEEFLEMQFGQSITWTT